MVEHTGYLGGASIEVPLSSRTAIEVNAIYRPITAGSPGREHPFTVLTWQFPVLYKYRWTRETWTPFAAAGPAFRLSGNRNSYDPSHFGVTVEVGLERSARGFRFAPYFDIRAGSRTPTFRKRIRMLSN